MNWHRMPNFKTKIEIGDRFRADGRECTVKLIWCHEGITYLLMDTGVTYKSIEGYICPLYVGNDGSLLEYLEDK